MKIYKDLFSGDELSSDAFPTKTVFGIIYEVETKQVTKSLSGNYDIGANASEEDPEESLDDGQSVTVNNLIDSHRLSETSYDKKAYMGHIKAYLKRVVDWLKANGREGEVAEFQAQAQEFVKSVVGKFDDFQFYTGETMDPEAMVALKFYKEDGIIPYFYFWRHGVREEKY